MTRTFVIFLFDSLNLILFFFKIDTFRKNVTISMTAIHNVVCAINSLRHFFNIFSTLSSVSLFEIILKKVFFVNIIIKIFRAILSRLNFEKHYVEHFFRRDVVIEAQIKKFFFNKIQMLNR